MSKFLYMRLMIAVFIGLMIASCSQKINMNNSRCSPDKVFNPSSDMTKPIPDHEDKSKYYRICDDKMEQEFRPILLTESEAEANLPDRKSILGIDSVYIPERFLTKTMFGFNVRGVRVYYADNNDDHSSPGIVIVGATVNRKDKNPLLSNRYYYFEGNSGKESKINRETAEKYVNNIPKDNRYFAFFDKSSVQYLLEGSDVSGLTAIPGQLTFVKGGQKYTFFLGQNFKGGSDNPSLMIEEDVYWQSTTKVYLGSKMPCPPDCGSTGDRLIKQ